MSDLKKESVFDGLGVSPGVGQGTAYVRESGVAIIPEYCLAVGGEAEEVVRFQAAVEQSRNQLVKIRKRSENESAAASEEVGFLLDAHIQMLEGSRLVRGTEAKIREQHMNAERAVQETLEEIASMFAALEDSYIASRQSDIHQVAARLVRNLVGEKELSLKNIPKGSVILAEELTPADTAQMDPSAVAGFACVLGGAESHTAIMARALGLPAVLGVAGIVGALEPGDHVIIDGDAGRVIINPTARTLEKYEERKRKAAADRKRLEKLRGQQARTLDGQDVHLQANVELPLELEAVLENGGEGVGLLRSEFLYMNRTDIPDEDEQYYNLRGMMRLLDGKPLTVRTLDIGGDKIAESLTARFGDSLSSALGLRGIRLSLNQRDLLDTQFRALLRASAYGPLRVLLPMVSTATEVKQARRILEETADQLRQDGHEIPDELPPLGAMIEVPGAALSADALTRVCDFFAIGSNDLTMYTLAIDRADDQVADMFDPLHPSVLRLIQFSAHAARNAGIPVSLCGEIAGNPRYTALLIGLGITDLSMGAASIPRIKQRLMKLNSEAARQRVQMIMEQWDSGRIAMLLDDFNDAAGL